jgi:mono/diheme cytochrome c family protein
MPPAAMDPEPAAGDTPSFKTDIWPIFSDSCAPCHTVANLGGQNIGAADKDAALADAKRTKTAILDRIESGNMPQGCGKAPGGGGNCLSQDDFDTIQAWVDGGTPP